MSNEFVQRQITGFMAPGDDTLANQYDPSTYLWQVQDVYPSTVMKLDPGKHTSGSLVIAATSGTAVLPLPNNYDTDLRLAVFISSTKTIKAVTVSPAHTTSTAMITAGANQSGVLVFNERITSVTLSNAGTADAVVTYSVWEYPADLSDPDSWQQGVQTVGYQSS